MKSLMAVPFICFVVFFKIYVYRVSDNTSVLKVFFMVADLVKKYLNIYFIFIIEFEIIEIFIIK